MKKVLSVLLLLAMCSAAYAGSVPYKDKNLSPEVRAKDLLGRMTIKEKVAQLQCEWGNKRSFIVNGVFDEKKAARMFPDGIGQLARMCEDLRPQPPYVYHATLHPSDAVKLYNRVQKFFVEKTRLGIPVISHEEGLHGQQTVDATSFPTPLGLACSWDEALYREVYGVVAKEIRSKGGSVALAPVIDICRDPRWGRTEETLGEDPYLNSRLGVAAVKGFQGDSYMIDNDHVAATLKHFGVHGQSEGGNNTAPSFMEERQAMEVFLKPFKTCIREAQPCNIMITYNDIWGIPAHANRHLLQDILRGQFGYRGLIVSDYGGISDIADANHLVKTRDEAGCMAFNAGVEVELPSRDCFNHLDSFVVNGKVPAEALDSAVYRVLLEKFRLGLFEHPYADADRAERIVGCEAHRQVAYRAAAESMVLLKNDNHFLPLDKDKIKTIALIGPNADRCIRGGYASIPRDTITPLRAMKERYGDKINVIYAEGARITDVNSPFPEKYHLFTLKENEGRIAEAVEVARKADVVVLFVGGNESTSREAYGPNAPGDLPTLDFLAGQKELIRQVVALGKPTCAFINSGTTMSLGELATQVPAIMQCWYLGQETGYAVVDALFGDINPSGKLTISFPRSAGHIPAYYSYKPTSRRGYNLGFDVTAQYPFGFGMSYTTYEYSNFRLEKSAMGKDESIKAYVDIRNTGSREGDEIAQLYIRDDYASVTRPVKELKDFKRVNLKPGEQKTVAFDITPEKLAFYDANMKWIVEPGDFTVMVGPSSADVKSLKLTVE